ncbi:MAG: EamA family transporter [Gammaproteobacteria bacterium]
MEFIWIPLSVFAAFMQAIRTAAQKTLNQRMSTLGTTYVRSLAGLPFLVLFLGVVLGVQGGGMPTWHAAFLTLAAAGALTQVIATALLIRLFTLKTFAVGSMLVKSDILMTAMIGSLWFSEDLSLLGWVALLVVLAGVLLLLGARFGPRALAPDEATLGGVLGTRATRIALGCALMFSFSYLFVREATLAIGPGSFLWRGGWTVVVVTGTQVICLGAWLAVTEPAAFKQLWPNRRLVGFIGLTSALGSIGWFTAFALENASYVRAVAQVEAVFTLLISWLYFRESVKVSEVAGIVVMIVGVLMFRLVD